jgi:hypothetical protein
MFLTIYQPITISPEVQVIYDSLTDLQPGSKVLLAFDYDPPSAPELQPMAVAVMKYCFKRNLKLYIIGLWPQGPMQANLAIEDILHDPDFKDNPPVYDRDYVNLGFQAGNELVIQGMGSNIHNTFSRDYSGRPTRELEMMKGVRNFSNIDFVFNLSAGYPGTVEWVLLAADRFHAKVAAGNTAVQAPQVYPYVQSGQLSGLAGGLKGAAELEKLVNYYGKGTKFMLSQSFAHMIVIFFIIVGNVAYFATRKKS